LRYAKGDAVAEEAIGLSSGETIAAAVAQHVPAAMARRAVFAATVGNALEFYDFVTYAFFAIQIGHAFFPTHNAYASLMLSLATFGAGFVTRPIGGIVIGAYADRVGRRPAMMLSFGLMGAAIVTIALIPPYSVIGIAAPVLAVLARMAQGFSLGGEVGPTTAYLLEAAPLRHRGLAVSWQGASQGIASTCGGAVGFLLSGLVAPAALDAYGWRIAFLVGAAILPFGLWVRRGLTETLHTPEVTARPAGARTGLGLVRENGRIIGLALAVLAAGTIGTYVFNYTTTFAEHTLHMTPGVAFLASALGSVGSVAAGLFGGWLSDRIGRRPVMTWPALMHLVMILPIFFWITQARSALALIAGTIALGILGSLGAGAFYAAVTETLPKRIRGSTFAIVYAVSISVFGGTTQLMITWLIHTTGNPMAPGWYLFAAATVGLAARWLILESAPVKMMPAGARTT
jgi:MFS family permease